MTALDLPIDRSAINVQHRKVVDDVWILPVNGSHGSRQRHEFADIEGGGDRVMSECGSDRHTNHSDEHHTSGERTAHLLPLSVDAPMRASIVNSSRQVYSSTHGI